VSRVRTYRGRQAKRAVRCHEGPSPRGHNLTIPLDLTISLEDPALAAHGHDVSAIAVLIADELDLSAEAIDHLRLAGLFHDIGKLWIPDRILEKTGPLTVVEWTEVHKHPESGALMLRAYGLDQEADWVLYHHERPDGLGYPYGLSGDEIPLESRVLAVADAWSAMRADRPYSAPVTREAARCELEYTRGEQFDAMLVDLFLDLVEPGLGAMPGIGAVPGH
jgi:putative nucleotidyltransferase with HDIG domain